MTNTPFYHLTEAERETPVARVREMADTIENYARRVRELADLLEKTGNIDQLSYVGNAVTNMISNLRIDLLVKYACEAYRHRVIDRHQESEAANG